jgi:ATP-dependent DNA helicase RecQ
MKPWKRDIHKRDWFTCQECGAKENPNFPSFQVHHKTEKKNGGSNHPDNLILLCEGCHVMYHSENACCD